MDSELESLELRQGVDAADSRRPSYWIDPDLVYSRRLQRKRELQGHDGGRRSLQPARGGGNYAACESVCLHEPRRCWGSCFAERGTGCGRDAYGHERPGRTVQCRKQREVPPRCLAGTKCGHYCHLFVRIWGYFEHDQGPEVASIRKPNDWSRLDSPLPLWPDMRKISVDDFLGGIL